MKILLVEDDALDALHFEHQHQHQHQLKTEVDVPVHVESRLTDGIERCQHESFDVDVLDLSLPDSSSLDTLHEFSEAVRSAPAIILLTGLDDRELALKAVQTGAQDFVVKGMMHSTALIQALRHSLERHRMSQELMAANDRVRYLTTHCSLTDLPNRYLFMDRLENGIVAAARTQKGLAVLFLDLDHFKPINDRFGHEAGDLVLRSIASRLESVVRASDTVARIGGDEFTLLLHDASSPVATERIAETLAREISKPIEIAGCSVVTHPSIGVAFYPADGTTADALLQNADAAMYYAKKHGEPSRLCSESLRNGARERIDLESDLADAIATFESESESGWKTPLRAAAARSTHRRPDHPSGRLPNEDPDLDAETI